MSVTVEYRMNYKMREDSSAWFIIIADDGWDLIAKALSQETAITSRNLDFLLSCSTDLRFKPPPPFFPAFNNSIVAGKKGGDPRNAIIKSFSKTTFHRIVKNCNHKRLGIYYLLSAFFFGISGTLISVLIRIELYSSGNRIISPENQNFYNISITLHGFLSSPSLLPGL